MLENVVHYQSDVQKSVIRLGFIVHKSEGPYCGKDIIMIYYCVSKIELRNKEWH